MSVAPPPAVASAPRVRARRTDRKRIIIVAVVIVAAIAFLMWRGLSNATLYFRTADEAVAQHQTLGTKRFRIEGVVVPGSIKGAGIFTDFAIASKNTVVQVRNDGQPLGIFQANIPVVLEGHFDSATGDSATGDSATGDSATGDSATGAAVGRTLFDSDQIMVKHSSDYDAKHPDRASGAANQ